MSLHQIFSSTCSYAKIASSKLVNIASLINSYGISSAVDHVQRKEPWNSIACFLYVKSQLWPFAVGFAVAAKPFAARRVPQRAWILEIFLRATEIPTI